MTVDPIIAIREHIAALTTALQMASGALRSMEHQSLVDPTSPIRFVGDWAHFGTMTISEILDRANEALKTKEPV